MQVLLVLGDTERSPRLTPATMCALPYLLTVPSLLKEWKLDIHTNTAISCVICSSAVYILVEASASLYATV